MASPSRRLRSIGAERAQWALNKGGRIIRLDPDRQEWGLQTASGTVYLISEEVMAKLDVFPPADNQKKGLIGNHRSPFGPGA